MAISRNSFPSLNVAQLQAKMNELSELVDGAARPGENIDISTLAAQVEAKNDPILSSAFERVSREYARFRGPSEGPVPPRGQIESKDVKSVMNMLIEAKQSFSESDSDGDGRLSRQEVLESRYDIGASHGQRIADGAAFGANEVLEKELKSVLQITGNKVEMTRRLRSYYHLRRKVASCAPSPLGEKALLAHMQSILVDQPRMTTRSSEERIHKVLKKAEHNFFRRLFGAPRLDDKEVAELIGTSDLKGYASSVEAKIKAEHGASFEELWLDGVDLEDTEGVNVRFNPQGS